MLSASSPVGRELIALGAVCFEDYLEVAILSLIELLVGLFYLLKRDVVAYNEARLRPSGDDHIPQVDGVALVVCAPEAHPYPLAEERRPRHVEVAALAGLLGGLGVAPHVYPGYTQGAGRVYEPTQVFYDLARMLAGRVLTVFSLKAHGIDAAHHTHHLLVSGRERTAQARVAPSRLQDLLDRIPFQEVDRNGADLARLLQPLGDHVHDVDLRCPPQERGVGGQKPYRSRPEDCYSSGWIHTRKLGGMPTRDPRVGQKHEVVFELIVRLAGELDAVDVGERYPQEFGLGAAIRTHPGVAVGCTVRARVYSEAGGAATTSAVEAIAAVEVGGHHYPIAPLHAPYRLSYLFDRAQRLVAQDQARIGSGSSVVHVQIAATDSARCYPHQGVSRLLCTGVLHLLDGNLLGALVDDRSHSYLTSSIRWLPLFGWTSVIPSTTAPKPGS